MPTDALPRRAPEADGFVLRVLDGVDSGREFVVRKGGCIVGTGEACDFRLRDSSVSGRHAAFRITADGIEVEDLRSTNGTLYLATRLTRATVHHGAVITVGRTRIAIAAHDGGEALLSARQSYGELVGASIAMRRMYHVLEQIETSDLPVLILGETGTGKELIARAIHRHSGRQGGPFEAINCGAVPRNLIEDELFGHAAGAFTGADRARDGLFARARNGTVLLDEIGELPLDLQPKLLRVLAEHVVRPLGTDDDVPTDTRLIAATHRDVGGMTATGALREDLYFRLSVVVVRAPALRERREDIPLLVAHFLERAGVRDLELSHGTLELFTSGYDWPGNVRELRNAIASIAAAGVVPERVKRAANAESERPDVDVDTPLQEAKARVIEAFEREYIASQLARAGGSIHEAARRSGMDRSHFKRLLRRLGMLS